MASALLDSLRGASLLPSPLIPTSFSPKFNLTISFPSLAPSNGSLARVSQVSSEPSISVSQILGQEISDAESKTYTLMLLDPDAPTPDDPKFAFWRHWIVISIQLPSPSSKSENIVPLGTTLTPYLAPGPKDESGPHRYLFLLFEEPSGYSLSREDVGGEEFVERRSLKAEELIKGKGLELVGVQRMRGVGDGWSGEVSWVR